MMTWCPFGNQARLKRKFMMKHSNAIFCPKCRRLISRDEQVCPYCGLHYPGAFWKNNIGSRIFFDPDTFVKTIIYLNVGIYIISLFLSQRLPGMSINPFIALSPDRFSLIILGGTGTEAINGYGRWWSLIAANYLHGGILHIAFNMIAFRQIAPLMIREFGLYRLMAIYTLGGVIGFLVSYFAGIHLTIGASAAVCSLIGALFYYGYSRGGIYGQVLFKQVGGWIISLFVFGFIIPGINNWGHGGGIVAGILLAFVLGYNEKRAENRFHKQLGIACAVITVMVLAYAVATGVYIRFMI